MKNFFTPFELILWGLSAVLITLSFIAFGGNGFLSFIASLIGVTSLIFNAKGNPVGQALMIVFSLLYGVISYSFSYYGEMITYLGMTMPMAAFALISWLKNPI
jgi:nicotinamide riboside transporter PnuC